jgi:hypothetical protein
MEEAAPTRDAEYLQGLRTTVYKGVEYGLELVAVGEERALPAPLALLMQSRLAARHRIPLHIVIRRYMAGKTVLTDFLLEEAAQIETFAPVLLRGTLAALEVAFERVLALTTEEYQREERLCHTSPEAQIVRRVQRLLSGELVDCSPLAYDLTGHHLGLIAQSAEAGPLIRRAATELGYRCLVLRPCKNEVWGWVGGRNPIDLDLVCRWLSSEGQTTIPFGLGEPNQGRSGWRLTHQQARLAVSIARDRTPGVTMFGEVALLAAFSRDSLLATSLQEKYLLPLTRERDRGHVLRTTLRAYFEAGRNGSSAAAALGVTRQTVANRLQAAEERLNQPLSKCGDLLHAALRLEELGVVDADS